VDDQLGEVVALGGGVLGVAAHVEVQREPLRRKTLELRPHDTTRRNR
jgi:hypothetical protein